MKIFIVLFCVSAVVNVSCFPIEKTDKKLRFIAQKPYDAEILQQKIDEILRIHSLDLHTSTTTLDKFGKPVVCHLCNIVMDIVLWVFKTPDRKDEGFFSFAIKFCERLHIERPVVCTGLINSMVNETEYALENVNATGEMICGLIFPTKCKSNDLPWNDKWVISLPKPLSKIPARKTVPSKPLRVLQVSDIHVDLHYTPGSQVDCADPICCRNPASGTEKRAGQWGSPGNCDTPYWTVENFLATVSKERFDYILWTGDLPAHDMWMQTRETQVHLLANITALLLKYFPDTPIYPALGNHESFPVNSFPPNYVQDYDRINWLYDALAKAWAPWLTKEAIESVKKSGFYTLLLRPGLRLISLNMNYCNDQNFWMLANPVDPNGELRWLVSVLTQAEKSGEVVHIIGHIPPTYSSDCLDVWRNNYFAIVSRFQKTITGQFFGHTHKDQLEIIYEDSSLKKPISVAYISPSLTTYPDLNPGFRIYDMNSSDWNILDHHSYILDLSKANQPGAVPEWELLYSAKQAYSLTSLSTESWDKLYQSWLHHDNERLFQKYFTYYYKAHTPTATCDEGCRKDLLCRIRAGNFSKPDCI